MIYYNGPKKPDIIIELENKIYQGWFEDKEELFNFLIELRTNGQTIIDSKKIRELLEFYDECIKNEQSQQSSKANSLVKVKTLGTGSPKISTTQDSNHHASSIGRAAFTKVGLLVINIITFILLVTMIILLNK